MIPIFSRSRRWLAVVLATVLFACPWMAHAKETLAMTEVIEIVRFKLGPGVKPADFAVLDRAVEREHVARQPGFIRRESAVSDDGEWLVIVHWATRRDADASMASFTQAAAAQAFMAGLDVSTMTT